MHLLLFLSFFLGFGYTLVNSSDVFIHMYNYNTNKYFCVTNSTSGMVWIEQFSQKKLTSVFFPRDNTDDYPTFLPKSSETFGGTILDRRWEELVSFPMTSKKKLRKNLTSFSNNEVAFSVLVENTVNVYLCDRDNLTTATCYWFLLQNHKTKCEKCRHCETTTTSIIKKEQQTSNFLTGKQWVHFSVSKTGDHLVLRRVKRNEEEVLLDFKDSNGINITYAFFESTKGLLKFHQTTTAVVVNQQNVTEIVNITDGSVCLSFFLLTNHCVLTVTAKESNRIIKKENYHSSNYLWKEIRFVADSIGSKTVEFIISTNNQGSCVIDKRRKCRNNELRAITADENITCQFVSENPTLSVMDQDLQNTCPENTFSKHCLPCSWFSSQQGSCDKIKFHEIDTKRFGCLPGYKGDNCDEICQPGFYGHFCGKKCGHCRHECHHISGKCTCMEAFRGDQCDIPPPIMFVSAPRIENVTFTEATIYIDNFTVINNFDNDYVYRYTIQYKKIDNGTWKENALYKYREKTRFQIKNLSPDSEYLVRFVIETKSGKRHFDELHNSTFTTLCLVNGTKIANITTFSTSVKLTVVSQICTKPQEPSWITASLPNSQKNVTEIVSGKFTDFTLTGLQPFTIYFLEVKLCRKSTACQKIKTQIKTKPAPPGPVRELWAYSKNESSVSLRWKQPPIFGTLEYYKVTWYILGAVGNQSKNINKTSCELWPEYQCITITNLKKNELYTLRVEAKIKEVNKIGNLSQIHIRTRTEPSSSPQNVSISWTSKNQPNISWYHPTTANGNIKLFNISFIQERESTKMIMITTLSVTNGYKPSYNTIVNINNLPSTVCTVSVSAYNGNNGTQATIKSVTPPSKPVLVQNPKISSTKNGILIQVPEKVEDVDDKSISMKIIVLISNKSLEGKKFSTSFINLTDIDVWYECDVFGREFSLTINNSNETKCNTRHKSWLDHSKCYNVTIVYVNTFKNTSSYNYYFFTTCFQYVQEESMMINLLIPAVSITIVLIVIIILLCFGYRKNLQKRYITFRKKRQNPIVLNDYTSINTSKNVSKPIKIGKLSDYIKSSLQNGELIRQHQEHFSIDTPYERIGEHIIVDFIDVPFLDQTVETAYLAANLPKPNEIPSFWKTVWHENITNIVFFDVCPNKSWKYWNDTFGKISVQLLLSKHFAHYEERRFVLLYKGATREIRHLRYTSTLYSLSIHEFLTEVSKIPLSSKSPLLVHSSSGIQQTGFVLLCDIALRTTKRHQEVNFVKICQNLSDCDMSFVNNTSNYILAHLVVLESLHETYEKIASTSMIVLSTEIKKHSQYLKETVFLDKTDIDKTISDFKSSIRTYSEVGEKDPLFTTHTIRGFQSKKVFVMEQPSVPNAFNFWRIVVKKNVSVIIALNDNFATSACWSQVVPSETIIFKHRETKKFSFYDWTTTQVIINNHENIVELFLVKGWEPRSSCPDTIRDFVNFCIETQKVLKNTESVLVTCCDGVTASSLYLAMIYNIEKMMNEGVCDVCTAVRMMRHDNKHFVQNEEQIIFLWEAAEVYLKETQLYERR